MGLGETLQPALQGFVTFATGSQRNTRVFTTLALADAAAELIAGPLTAALMAIGRTENHPSDGLCFLASSVRCVWTVQSGLPESQVFFPIIDQVPGNICSAFVMDVFFQNITYRLATMRYFLFYLAAGFMSTDVLSLTKLSGRRMPLRVYYVVK